MFWKDERNMVETCTHRLAQAITRSPEYQEYERCKARMHEYPELKKRMEEFRERGYVLQNSKEGGELYDEIDRLETEYEDVNQHPLVTEYLAAEMGVCRLMQNISRELLKSIDLELDLCDC